MTDRETLLELLATCGTADDGPQTVHRLLQILLAWDGGDDEPLTRALEAACWRTRPQPGA